MPLGALTNVLGRNTAVSFGGASAIGRSLPVGGGDENWSPYSVGNLAAYYTAKNYQYTADASNRVSQWYDVSGNSGTQLLNFNGTAGCTVANIPAFGTGDFTLAFWYTHTTDATRRYVVSGGGGNFTLSFISGTAYVSNQGVTEVNHANSAVTSGVLSQVVYTRSGTTGAFYINGVSVGASGADASNYSGAITNVGKDNAGGGFLNGSLSNLLIYNRALSAGEVASLYANGPYGTPPASGLKLSPAVPFTRGATTITDTSGNSATITLPASGVWISGARDLAQVTGANQPLLLPWSGSNYLYGPGTSGNNATTAAPTGMSQLHLEYYGALDSWTPADYMALMSIGANFVFNFYVEPTTGKLRLEWSDSGAVARFLTSSTGTGFAAGTVGGVKATLNPDNGSGDCEVKFYTSTDGTNWSQLGSTRLLGATSSIRNIAGTLRVHAPDSAGALYNVAGKCYWATIRGVINGTVLKNFNPSLAQNNASTVIASTGETWTINSTGAKPAQIVGLASMLFDGSAYYLKSAPFTLNQPTTVYLVGKQNTWTSGRYLYDGNAINTGNLTQSVGTPALYIYAGGAAGTGISSLALLTNGVVTGIYNGASSAIRINRLASVAGASVGTNNMGGFCLGTDGSSGGTAFANFQASEVLIFSQAHDTATQDRIIRWLGARNAINV